MALPDRLECDTYVGEFGPCDAKRMMAIIKRGGRLLDDDSDDRSDTKQGKYTSNSSIILIHF